MKCELGNRRGKPGLPGRRTALLRLGVLLLGLWSGHGAPARAHPESAGSLPLVPHSLVLRNRSAAEILLLLTREALPDPPSPAVPRAARTDNPDTLLPSGAQAVYRTPMPEELVLVTTEGAEDAEACLRVLDAPLRLLGPQRARIQLRLRRAGPAALRAAVLRLPGAGSAALQGTTLTLEGTPGWLHQAQRTLFRAEIGHRLPQSPTGEKPASSRSQKTQ
ncbi:MAG: hypothetical protein FJX77_14965 [Armatimonadetes bacterium]|nr:hypothetical protein [Armatimonadota bacterium]